MNIERATKVQWLVLTWFLMAPLLFFTARGMFSFDRAQYTNTDGSTPVTQTATASDTLVYRAERITAYGIVFISIAASFKATARTIDNARSILLLPMLAIVSALWSQEFTRTLFFGVLALVLTCFGGYLTHRFSGERIVELFLLVGMIAAAASLVIIILFPSIGVRHFDGSNAWQGLFVQKNTLGIISVYLIIAPLVVEKRGALRMVMLYGYIGLSFALIAMCQSRTAWLELGLVLVYFSFERIYIRSSPRGRGAVVAFLLFSVASAAYVAWMYGGDLAVAVGKTRDMTGRGDIFKAIYPVLWKRPLTGFGYQAFWLGLKGESARLVLTPGHSGLANAENGILQMWLEMGALGTIATLAVLALASFNALVCLAHSPPPYIRWSCAVIFLSLLELVNGDKIMYPDTIEWLLFVVAYLILIQHMRLIRDQQFNRSSNA